MRSPLHFGMHCLFVIRSYTFLISSHTFLPAFNYNLLNSGTFLYVLCDSHTDSAMSTRIQWLCPPPFTRESSCAKACSLLSSHTFCYTFLYVLGRPITSWIYGIPGPPMRRPTRHPISHHFPANRLSQSPECTEVGCKSLRTNTLKHPSSCCLRP